MTARREAPDQFEIKIRSVQQYMYCPHRWGLMEIGKVWAENAFVTKANLMHERVHDPERTYSSRGRKVYTSVQVYRDEFPYNLYGVTDCLELTADGDGVLLPDGSRRCRIQIVEYKPTKPKDKDWHEEDLMQVFAQKICVDSVFKTDAEGYLYYADVKKRIKLPLRENYALYDEYLKKLLAEMRGYLSRGEIPAIRKGQKCSGCSMKDLCMPTLKSRTGIREEIRRIGGWES